jgi:hypothetical protein
MADGLFGLNIISISSNNNSSAGCAYIVESIDLWHGKDIW